MNTPHTYVLSDLQVESAFRELASGNHGHFAAKLADAWFVADSNNRGLIEITWSHLVIKGHTYATDRVPV